LQFKVLVEYSRRLKKTSSRNDKVDIVVDFLKQLNQKESAIGASYISGKIRQGKLNIAWKGLSELPSTAQMKKRAPNLVEIDRYLEKTKAARGKEKVSILLPLFAGLNKVERKYLISLIFGEVQQGAGEGVVQIAIARFFDLKDEEIERAYLEQPDIGELFSYLLKRGGGSIGGLGIRLFSPVKPMLAQIANSIDDVFDVYDDFSLEFKLDGVRIQVHRDDEKVKIYSRNLKDITVHFPELVNAARTLPVKRFILDGEAIGIDDRGRPVPFQILARRTTRKKDIGKMQKKIPVRPQFFDVLHIEGDDLTRQTYKERLKVLNDLVRNKKYRTERTMPPSMNDAREFYETSLKQGNEGIMLKLHDSQYRPGKRGKLWFKIKGAHTIDCVILAAEWGHGRRHGWLSNLHLGVLDETRSKYLMVGKTFKGLTDKMLAWLTDNLPKQKVHEDRWTVYVKPKVVVEIAFNEVQKSPRYESGVALRFARVKRIRNDKKPDEINTILDLKRLKRAGISET
jgi:DNA ligase-1